MLGLNSVDNEDDAKWRVVIGHDQDVEDPTEYGPIEYMYDNSKSFDRDMMWCHLCGEASDFVLHDPESPHRAMMQIHNFVWHPRVVAVLMGGARRELPASFDAYDLTTHSSSEYALMVVRETEFEYWETLNDEQKEEVLQAVYDEWRTWSDGECYWASVERIVRDKCGECHRKLPNENIESCGGFIGDVAVSDFLKDIVKDDPVWIEEKYY